MNPAVLKSILDLKKAALDEQVSAMAEIQTKLDALQQTHAEVKASLVAPEDVEASIGTMRISARWRLAQIARLDNLVDKIETVEGDRDRLEDRLRDAFGEKQAIERLLAGR